jgi:hypothetical protein
MAKSKFKLNLLLKPLKMDIEKCRPDDIFMTNIKMNGVVPTNIGIEIASAVGAILKKHDKKITEKNVK